MSENAKTGKRGRVVLNGDIGENNKAIDDTDEYGKNDQATFSTSCKLNIILFINGENNYTRIRLLFGSRSC